MRQSAARQSRCTRGPVTKPAIRAVRASRHRCCAGTCRGTLEDPIDRTLEPLCGLRGVARREHLPGGVRKSHGPVARAHGRHVQLGRLHGRRFPFLTGTDANCHFGVDARGELEFLLHFCCERRTRHRLGQLLVCLRWPARYGLEHADGDSAGGPRTRAAGLRHSHQPAQLSGGGGHLR